jgi:hypothetical protein
VAPVDRSTAVRATLPARYPDVADEIDRMQRYTDLAAAVYYGPRFINTNK